MTEEERIEQLLYRYERAGLVEKDLSQVLACLADRVVGIGIGEQGFVTSLADVEAIFHSGMKDDASVTHSVDFDRIEILVPDGRFGTVCAKVVVSADNGDTVTKSEFMQSLTVMKQRGEWRICGLHASAMVVTEDNIEAYPLKFAEKTLCSLREKIGEEVYAIEEQYRKAVLADTVAFYILNFTTDRFEKCQLNGDLCVYVEPGTPYQEYITRVSPHYVYPEEQDAFISCFSLQNISRAFAEDRRELQCEYRMVVPDGAPIWMCTMVRLITDIATGERKGIMYVKNIDSSKRREIAMQNQAALDGLTGVYNVGALRRLADHAMQNAEHPGGSLLMLDVDNFKHINDTYGHPAGDEVLIAVARALKEKFRQDDLAGRLGGDEFAVFLRGDWSAHSVESKARALLDCIHTIRIAGSGETVSCSVGVALCHGLCSFETMYHSADRALYESKQHGKNCCTLCSVQG